jgi:hypothetical protein
MRKELKQAIINYIFDNSKEYQLHNSTAQKFRNYIFDNDGEYLIGGEDVLKFIGDAIKLLSI